jgi:hypothetical protein
VVSDTVPNGTSSFLAWKTRPKNASDIDISDSTSIFRGMRSPIHNLENALAGTARGALPNFGSPSTKRKSYCLTQGAATLA